MPTLATDISDPAQNWYMGSAQNASNYFNGKLDDVRIYNRALTPAEIALLAQGPVCSSPTAPEGRMIYNDDHAVMQYCNGKDWVAVGR